ELKQAPKDSIIVITTYYSDIDGQVAGFENFSQLVRDNSSVPIYDLYDFGIGHGALGGSMLSGYLQGESAAKLALQVLEGRDVSQIPVDRSKTTRYIFDYSLLQHFNIPLSRLPSGSEIINRPYNVFIAYKNLFITIAIIFVLLIFFIIILIHYLRKVSRMKNELYESNSELAQLYEELAASEEELRQQLEELMEMQKSLEQSEERYRILFEKMLNGFFVFESVLNDEGELVDIRFVNMNPAVKKQLDARSEEYIGKTWMEVMGYKNRALKKYENILKTGEAAHFEIYYPEQQRYYLDNAFKVDDTHVGVVFDNITEYKQAIKEVQKLNEELEKRVVERTSELQSAVQELEAFTYTVSHDLKSPLRAIDGYSRIVMEDFGNEMDEEAVQMISNIMDICKDMIEMINKLLRYATTSRTVLAKEEFDLGEMLCDTFNELKSSCMGRKIDLIIENALPKVEADRILMKQLLTNLLSNAVKFTKNRAGAIIRVGCVKKEDEYMIYIKDNGAGFDMEYSSKLFGLFQRLHSSEEFEGSGIGLVTVRKIIQKHGGRVWMEGRLDEGAAVYFTLPYTKPGDDNI
ncbi:MAG: ATP-binding protein, partial [Bacillota bacterium]|nr:ATP-binding protein [Bacillota bacterium]